MSAEALALGPILALLLAAALVLLTKTAQGSPLLHPPLILLPAYGVALALHLALLSPSASAGMSGVVGLWEGPLGIPWRVDGVSWGAGSMALLSSLVAYLAATSQGPHHPVFHALWAIQTAAMVATLVTDDLFNLYVCLELSSLTSYALIAMGKKEASKLASLTYLFISAASMVFFLLGTYTLYRLTGSLNLGVLGRALEGEPMRPPLAAAIALVSASVVLRSALTPLYGWLPEAHAQAPHPVSAVLSGVLIKTPLFALGRFLTAVPGGDAVGEAFSWAGSLGAVVGGVIALSQLDVKRLLAYTTISQIGFVVAAWGAAVAQGPAHPRYPALMGAALIWALIHALYKGQLFLGFGFLVDVSGDRSVAGLGGGLRSRGGPTVLILTVPALLTMAGLPFLPGQQGKLLLGAALGQELKDLLLSVGSVLNAACTAQLVFPLLAPQQPSPQAGPPRAGGGLLVALGLQALALIAVGLGFAPLREGTAFLVGGPLPSSDLDVNKSLEALGLSALGLALALAARTPLLRSVLTRIRNRPRSFPGLFVAFLGGALALGVWVWGASRL